MRFLLRAAGAAGIAAAISAPAEAAHPMSYLSGFGAKAYPVVALTWGLIIVSAIVLLICTVLVVVGAWRRRVSPAADTPTIAVALVPVRRGPSGQGWLSLAVGISFVVLLGSLVWTVVVLAAVTGPPREPKVTIEVTGQQWWWKARYINKDNPSATLTTANEIHIPTGEPVRIKLIGGDVIHSFWVPPLSGKTDTIPGQVNETWLEAENPGRYRGQCTEFCGWQHAHMALFVVAEPRPQFERWLEAQLRPAPTPKGEAVRGEHRFVFRCGACHTVRGTEAGGTVAPDLTHLMSRATIAAGTLPNTVAYLS
ncbi:MAG TPA: cytochrome c oxidase subunit II, partial [Stellaceae bacterium]